LPAIHGGVLRIRSAGAIVDHSIDEVALREIAAEPGVDDLARDVVSDDERELVARGDLELAFANDDVFRVHANEAGSDEDLPARGDWAWDCRKTEDVRAAIPIDDDGAHRFTRMKVLSVLWQRAHFFVYR